MSVKIFNLLMAELGPGVLRHGVLVNAAELTDYLAERSQEFRQGCSVTLDGKHTDIMMLESKTALAGRDLIFFTVTSGPISD